MEYPNCKSQLSCSAMEQTSPRGIMELFSGIDLKVSKLDKQEEHKKIQTKICLDDQAVIAWFTSIRGVY